MWFHVTSVCLTLATLVLAVLWNLYPEDSRYEPATVALAILTTLIGSPSLFELLTPPQQPQNSPEEKPTELTKHLFIIDWICRMADSIDIWDGLGEKKRKLHLMRKLHASALAYFDLSSKGIDDDHIFSKVLFFVRNSPPELLSELDYLHLCSSKEERPDRTRLKKLKHLMQNEWEFIKEILFEDKELKFEFDKLKLDEKRWALIGFDNEAAYEDYIAPSLATLCKNAGRAEKLLLSQVVNMEEFTLDILRMKGYTEGILAEIINCFYRERILVDKGNGNLSVSDLGKQLIIGYLKER